MGKLNKLIELLNEFEENRPMELPRQYRRKEMPTFKWWLVAISEYDDEMVNNSDLLAVSKFNWFIKWLVDNDKIDREKIDWLKLIPTLTYQNMIEDCDCWKSHWHPYTFAGYVDELLMLLSISDTPIDDLISYLR